MVVASDLHRRAFSQMNHPASIPGGILVCPHCSATDLVYIATLGRDPLELVRLGLECRGCHRDIIFAVSQSRGRDQILVEWEESKP
jgi:hypothetical protein